MLNRAADGFHRPCSQMRIADQPRAAVGTVDPISHLLPGIPEDTSVSRFHILPTFVAIPVATVEWKTEIGLVSGNAVSLYGQLQTQPTLGTYAAQLQLTKDSMRHKEFFPTPQRLGNNHAFVSFADEW